MDLILQEELFFFSLAQQTNKTLEIQHTVLLLQEFPNLYKA